MERHLRLYDYAASGNAFKVRLLLAHLGLPYERVTTDIFGGDTLTAEYARINPRRTVPVLEVAEGTYLRESNAILLYLAEGTPYLPEDPLRRAEVVGWLVYEQAEIFPGTGGLRFRLLTGRLTPDHPDAVARLRAGRAVLDELDRHLRDRPFLVGDDYTIADVSVYSYAHLAHEAGHDMARHPAFARWLDRVAEQPGFVNDLAPFPPNAMAGAGRSLYG